MSRQARVLSFGTAFLAIVLGAVLGPVLGGVTGEVVALSLAGLGGIGVVSLVFFEVGLSEDRERANERAARDRAQPPRAPVPPRLPRRRRPG